MMSIFSVYYRRVFMNQLKLVDQKMIIIVLVLLYFLNLKIVELIPATGDLFVSLCFDCFFFVIRKGKNSITIKDYLSSSLQFSSSSIPYKIRQYTLKNIHFPWSRRIKNTVLFVVIVKQLIYSPHSLILRSCYSVWRYHRPLCYG